MEINEAKLKMQEYSNLMDSLRTAGVVRDNNIVGSYAEWLTKEVLNLVLADPSQKDFDAVGSDGKKYQIKARWNHDNVDKKKNSLEIGKIHTENPDFDYLLILIFKNDFSVECAFQLSRDEAVEAQLGCKSKKIIINSSFRKKYGEKEITEKYVASEALLV